MIDLRQLSGIMDLDSPNENFPKFHHKRAVNMRFRGNPGNMRGEPVFGNILVPNSSLPSTGSNECIGSFYDPVRKRVFSFNYNSSGLHGIYYYDGTSIVKVFLCGTDSATDILNFSLDFPVHSAVMVYRPSTDGDILYWTDGSFGDGNRPRRINIDTVASLVPFTEDMINAGINAPASAPTVQYTNDSTVNSNNLRRQLFRFIQRGVNSNLEKTAWSSISDVPLPVDGYTPDTQNNISLNNCIEVTLTAGAKDWTTIELAVQVCDGTTWSDFSLVDSLKMADYGILPGGTYVYKFFNDGAYTPIDISETNLYYSFIPDKANALELLNGNVIIYAGTTEGYPPMQRSDVDVLVTAGVSNPNIPSISFQYTSSSEIIAFIGSVITVGATYHVQFDYSSGAGPSSSSVNYVTLGGDTPSSVATAIAALLNVGIVQGIAASNTFQVIINGTPPNSISNVEMSVSVTGSESAGKAWLDSTNEQLAILYLTDENKPVAIVSFIGASVDTNDFAVTTPLFTVNSTIIQVPFLSMTINHIPPEGATHYKILRASKTPKFLNWITNDYNTDTDFLYFGIQNLAYTQSRLSGYIPSYDFSKGDRIKVQATYNPISGVSVPFDLQLDMEILGTVQMTMNAPNPATTGTFIKVAKPATFPSSPYTQNMRVVLYTPNFSSSTGQQIFYEWAKDYDIYELNGVRYHRGQSQDQAASQPAVFQWFDGDVYFKNRTFFLTVNDASPKIAFMMDANYSDYFSSAVNSNGRGWPIDPNFNKVYNPVQLKWSGQYQQDTNINQLNIFQSTDFDTIDRAKGAICRLMAEERLLYVYQQHGVGNFGVFARYIQNNQGQPQLVTTNDIITKNNINYLKGRYGLGTQPTAIWRGSGGVHYFIDDTAGDILRRSLDGIINLSELYYGQYELRSLIVPYNNGYIRTNGGKAKIFGAYDFFEGQSMSLLQAGNPNTIFRLVANQTITNGDINSPNTISLAHNSNIDEHTYVVSFEGTPFTGEVITITLSLDGIHQITRPLVVLAGWSFTDIINNLASLINGDPAYSATATTYLGNPAVQVQGAAGTEVPTGNTVLTYPAYVATFTGTPSVGDRIDITVYFSVVDPHTFSYVFGAGNTISDAIASLVSTINGAGLFTAVPVTYNGFSGLTIRYLPSYVIVGNTVLTVSVSGSLSFNTFSFNEKRNGFCSFYDFDPEWIASMEDIILTWKNGNLYIHTDDVNYCNFYGTQFYPKITLVFNDQQGINKVFNSLGYQSENKVWQSSDNAILNGSTVSEAITTSFVNPQTGIRQTSRLKQKESNFEFFNGKTIVDLLRDINSRLDRRNGLWQGDWLTGFWIEIPFEYRGSDLVSFFAPYINYEVSNRNY